MTIERVNEAFTAEDVRERARKPKDHHSKVLSALLDGPVRTGRIPRQGSAIRATHEERNNGPCPRWQAAQPPHSSEGAAA